MAKDTASSKDTEDTGDPYAYSFRKDRLTKGWSYPVTRSRLDETLVEAKASNVVSVAYYLSMTPLADRPFAPLRVCYYGEDRPSMWSGQCTIFVYTVPSESRAEIALALDAALPAVARWVVETKSRTPTWRATSHELEVTVTPNGAKLCEGSPRFRRRR